MDRLYEQFLPLQKEVLGRHCTPIPGVVDLLAALAAAGVPVGSTTGYTRDLMSVVLPLAKEAGVAPAAAVCSDDVPVGRPRPWMLLEALKRLDAAPVWRAVKFDDTPMGVTAARNAGCWASPRRQRQRPGRDRRGVGRHAGGRPPRQARPDRGDVPRRRSPLRHPDRRRRPGGAVRDRRPPCRRRPPVLTRPAAAPLVLLCVMAAAAASPASAHDGPDPLVYYRLNASAVEGDVLKARLGPPATLTPRPNPPTTGPRCGSRAAKAAP